MIENADSFRQLLGLRAAQLLIVASLSYLGLAWFYELYPALYTTVITLCGYALAILLYRYDRQKIAARVLLLTLLGATFFITNYAEPATGIGHLYFILTALIVVVLDSKQQRVEVGFFLGLTICCLSLGFLFDHNLFGVRVSDLPVSVIRYGGAITSGSAILVIAGLVALFVARSSALSESQAELINNLDQANSAKSVFLANMSHEIRTPLNGIFGSLQVIRGSLEDQSTVARYTNVAMQSYHSIIGIVNDILDLSKLAENKVEIYPEPSNVAELVSLVSSEMGAVALNKGIDLSSSCSPELAGQTRLIDRTRLTQVLRNFLSNAVKFTKSGSVTIDAQVGKNADEVVITITDTGVGIPEEKLSAIFEPFEQVESSRAVERSGTGLGLPIAKQLAELMGGSITVKSTEGVGTTFTVVLKLPQTTLARTDKRSAIDISKLQPARILLAEDVMTNRMIFNALLKDCPYTIEEVENGELAVERALSQDYDLVLLDIQMPVMDGLSALHALKTVDYPKSIIACTANVMKEDIVQYMEAGFDSVIGKPYIKEDLVACIQAAVTRGGFSSTNR